MNDLATSPDAGTSVCPACAKPLAPGASRCANCGVALGEHQRCMFCRAIVDVERSADVRFVCSVCGGVRIPIDDPAVVRSTAQIELLKKATVARSARLTWRIVAWVVAAFGGCSVLVLALVVSVARPPTLAVVVAGVAALVPFAFAAMAWRKSQRRGSEIAGLVEAAWMAAVADVARGLGGALDAPLLAKLTRVSEQEADQLLERMSAKSLLVTSVTAEGKMKYTLLEGATAESLRPLLSG
jgi:hypothetical protein